MRLPEFNDCETVGRSIGLNEDQIAELGRLEKGVAVIYQNNWLEAVLAKIDKCGSQYEIKSVPINDRKNQIRLIGELLSELIVQDETRIFNMSWFNTSINRSKVSECVKMKYRALLTEYQRVWKTPEKNKAFVSLIAQILDCDDLFRIFEDKLPPVVKNRNDINKEYRKKCREWRDCICDNLDAYAEFFDKKIKDRAFMCALLYKIATEKKNIQYKLVLYCI